MSTSESRLAILQAFKAFLNLPENNKFGYDYVVNDASDLTPPDETDQEPMDHYIQDDMIMNIIDMVYENTDQSWYSTDEENAHTALRTEALPQDFTCQRMIAFKPRFYYLLKSPNSM